MQTFYGPFFRFAKCVLRVFCPGKQVDESGQGPGVPAVFVAHHQNSNGPFYTMLWSRRPLRIWSLHPFLDRRACFEHYTRYTFTVRYGWPRFVAAAIAWPVAAIVTRLLRSGGAIPVYRGSVRIRETFSRSMDALFAGESLVIFPDIDYTSKSSQIGEIYEGFLQIERMYFKATGKHIAFVPMSVDAGGRRLCIGRPVMFKGDMPFAAEKRLIAAEICRRINELSLRRA